VRNAQALGSGHTFVLVLQNAYPINVLNAIRNVPEVCTISCATANPVEICIELKKRFAAESMHCVQPWPGKRS
jgi:adenosine/AMP kinase